MKQFGHVEIRNLAKRFGGDGGVLALRGIDLSIRRGSFVTLLGPSGCGKSTLLSLIAGLDQVSQGEIYVDGHPVRKPVTSIGMIFQNDLLLDWRTAVGNILLQMEMRGQQGAQFEDEAQRLLRQVGIAEFAQSYPRQLSGGMRQRVAICRALIHNPSLLLMDEPFGALDAITREKVALDLDRLTGEGDKTVIFVTHSIEEAVFLGDRVLVMSARPGQISADIAVDIPRPRLAWPRGRSRFDPYVDEARQALDRTGAFLDVASG